MLHRLSKSGLICITQLHHAWLSGELARAWGNEQFGKVSPQKEVCLAAQHHDIGWLQWEEKPTLNPHTGYPYKFTEIPTQEHIQIWSNAKHLSSPFDGYVKLLISLHGTGLYERFTSWQKSNQSSHIVENFLKHEYAFQSQLINSLEKDAYYAPYTSSDEIHRNKKLVATWDAFSIILCVGKIGEQYIEDVPTHHDTTRLKLTLTEDQEYHQLVTVSPWTFTDKQINLVYEGRLLRETFTNESVMQAALISDSSVTLTTTLIPE